MHVQFCWVIDVCRHIETDVGSQLWVMSYCQEIWYQLVSYLKEAMINNYTLSVSTPVCDLIVVSLVLLMVIALVLGMFYTCHQAVYFGSHTNKEE